MARRLLASLLGVLLLAFSAQADSVRRQVLQAGSATLRGRALVLVQHPQGQPPNRLLVLHTSDGQHVHVQSGDPSQLTAIRTGQDVEARGLLHPSSSGASTRTSSSSSGSAQLCSPGFTACLRASSLKPLPTATYLNTGATLTTVLEPSLTAPATTNRVRLSSLQATSELNTLFIPIQALDRSGGYCNGTGAPPLTSAALRAVVFSEFNPHGYTVGSGFSQCSFNKTRLTPSNSLVAEVVSLPCTCCSANISWNFRSCEFSNWLGWAMAADQALKERGVAVDKYKFRFYMLPPGPCSFVGVGVTGCDGSMTCRSWVGPGYWSSPSVIIHEYGHNLGLEHAGAPNATGGFDEYGDNGCVMGYCCDNRCFNTPHSWQLGWICLQELDGSNLAPGQTVTATLHSQSLLPRAGMRIVPSWAPGADPLFLGYRTRAGGDKATRAKFVGMVHIYTSRIQHRRDSVFTTWKAALQDIGRSWRDPSSGLVVRIKGFPRGSAAVTVCRPGGPETAASCEASIDNNCDGFAGAKDAACAKFLPPGGGPLSSG